MGKPSAPKPPDPYKTAAAATGTNISTAVANSILGNVNQTTPDGSLTWTQGPQQFVADANAGQTYYLDPQGNYHLTLPGGSPVVSSGGSSGGSSSGGMGLSWGDDGRARIVGGGGSWSSSGGGGTVSGSKAKQSLPEGWTQVKGMLIPTWNQSVEFSPQNQAIYDQYQGSQLNLATLANERSAFLNDYLSQPMDTSNLPGLVGSAGLNSNFSSDLGPNYNQVFNQNIGGGYNTRFNQNIGGSYTDTLGPGYTTGVDLAKTYSGADDFSADRQRYEDVIWGRGADERARTEEALRTRLLNSGIREGTAGWNSEMERLSRQNEDARLSAYLASGQEQSRMVGLAHQAATFGNQSILAESMFGNDALTNQFQLQNNAALNAAQFGSQQQQAQNQAAMGQAQFGQNAQQLQNAAAMGQAQFGSQQQQAANQALLAGAQFQNQARSQGLEEAYAARSQPINEVIGLMGGSQVSQPTFGNTNMPTIPTVDMGGLINNHYNQQLNAYQMEQASAGGLLGGIGSLAGSMIGLSDDEAKKDKKRLGDVEDEMGLWEFRYKGEPKSQPKHIGLMASEVEKVKPKAIRKKDGLRYVDYGAALGLKDL